MRQGWVKNWREIKNWEWYKYPNMAHLFQHLVREANHKDGRWQGVLIKKGQLLTSYAHLALETGIAVQSIRTCIKHLKSTSEISHQSTSRYSLITINEYESYQPTQQPTNNPTNKVVNKQPTSDQQAANNKQEGKELKNKYIPKDFELANFFLNLIRKHTPKFEPRPSIEKWADGVRLMRERDGFSSDEIAAVFRWAMEDEFWHDRVLSPASFRKKSETDGVTKFERIKMQMGRTRKPEPPAVPFDRQSAAQRQEMLRKSCKE